MLKRISVLQFSLLCLAMSAAVPAFALDRNDEEWLNAGCPKDSTGNWILRDATAGARTLTVESNQIKFTSETGDKKTLRSLKRYRHKAASLSA